MYSIFHTTLCINPKLKHQSIFLIEAFCGSRVATECNTEIVKVYYLLYHLHDLITILLLMYKRHETILYIYKGEVIYSLKKMMIEFQFVKQIILKMLSIRVFEQDRIPTFGNNTTHIT